MPIKLRFRVLAGNPSLLGNDNELDAAEYIYISSDCQHQPTSSHAPRKAKGGQVREISR